MDGGFHLIESFLFGEESFALRLGGVERADDGAVLVRRGPDNPAEALDALPRTAGRGADDGDLGVRNVESLIESPARYELGYLTEPEEFQIPSADRRRKLGVLEGDSLSALVQEARDLVGRVDPLMKDDSAPWVPPAMATQAMIRRGDSMETLARRRRRCLRTGSSPTASSTCAHRRPIFIESSS